MEMARRVSFVVLALVVLAGYLFAQKTATFNGFELADKTGKILRKPADYRDQYEILGTYMVLDPKGNQMHFTYASRGAAEYYRQNKKFADGTVLVKEISGTDHAQMTTRIGPRE
jgi:Cytochrome P460